MILRKAYHCIDVSKFFLGHKHGRNKGFFFCLQKSRELPWFDNPTTNKQKNKEPIKKETDSGFKFFRLSFLVLSLVEEQEQS